MPRTHAIEALSDTDRAALAPALASIVREVFKYPSRQLEQDYIASLIDALSGRGWLVCYTDGDALVGFNLVTLHDVEVGGQTVTSVSSTALLRPGFSGRNRTMRDALRLMAGHLLRNPDRPVYLVSVITSPRPYALMADVCPSVHPTWARPVADPVEAQLVEEMVARRGLRRSSVNGVVRDMGTPRRYRDGDWEDPHVRFFQARVPYFSEGDGLCVCARISWKTLAVGALRQLWRMFARPVTHPRPHAA